MVDSSGKRAPRFFEPPPWESQQSDELAAAKQVRAESAKDVLAEAEPAKIDEAAMAEMLAKLAAEETHTNQGLWQAGVVASVGVGSIGLIVLIFGFVGFARTAKAGPVGVAGGAILVVFGLGMIALAIWLVVRTLKQRGVL
ncbi:MAG: hypothetical protein Q7U89_04765 [Coriobacteriia bacterium]|nr:hypothetical protein [Coriobacteriia bacterium]